MIDKILRRMPEGSEGREKMGFIQKEQVGK
jgi:hypothetical protein